MEKEKVAGNRRRVRFMRDALVALLVFVPAEMIDHNKQQSTANKQV